MLGVFLLATVSILAAVLLAVPLAYSLGWPLRRTDKRKMARFLEDSGDTPIEMRGRGWPVWEWADAAHTWKLIPVRVYTVLYDDRAGRRHQAIARFYPPWWLMPTFDSPFEDDFDLIEQ